MINKQPSYSSIKAWADKLEDYKLEDVYFSVTAKPRVILRSNPYAKLRKLLATPAPWELMNENMANKMDLNKNCLW
jgi:hypothetical protein